MQFRLTCNLNVCHDFGIDRKNLGKIGGPGNFVLFWISKLSGVRLYSAIIVRDRVKALITRRLVLEPIPNQLLPSQIIVRAFVSNSVSKLPFHHMMITITFIKKECFIIIVYYINNEHSWNSVRYQKSYTTKEYSNKDFIIIVNCICNILYTVIFYIIKRSAQFFNKFIWRHMYGSEVYVSMILSGINFYAWSNASFWAEHSCTESYGSSCSYRVIILSMQRIMIQRTNNLKPWGKAYTLIVLCRYQACLIWSSAVV